MLLDELALYLQTQGLGTVGTTIFKGTLPDQPDACTAVFEYAGLPSEKTFSPTPGAAVEEKPRVQIVCRGIKQDYQTPRTQADAIWKALDGLGNVTMSGTGYLWIEALQSPFLMRRDENERVYIAVNYQVMKRLS
jgi:hypothetical protein